MIECFNDAKRVTLSGWSWPARHIASNMAQHFEKNGNVPSSKVFEHDFTYLTPESHATFIDAIVKSDLEVVTSSLRKSLAVSLRVDGSVDRTHTHKIYVMAHMLNQDLTTKTLFMGFGVPQTDGAEGYYKCLQQIVGMSISWAEFFNLVTSLVTDGEPLNLGRLNGLFAMLQRERLRSSPRPLPLYSVWCVAHRINLAWKSTCKSPSIANTIRCCIKLSKFFRKSGVRTHNLKVVAESNKLRAPIRFPPFFEVRWSEYVYDLLNAVLRNYRASIQYFKLNNWNSFLTVWLRYDRVHFVTFLADVLLVLKKFQKACQSDHISIADVPLLHAKFTESLELCKDNCLEGGWEQHFLESVVTNGNVKLLHGIELTKSDTRTAFRFMPVFRHRIIRLLVCHVNMRIHCDALLHKAITPLVNVSTAASQLDIQACHSFIVPDVDQQTFLKDYKSVAELLSDDNSTTPMANLCTLNSTVPEKYHSIKTGLARIITTKPHSADVERLISK